MRSKRRSGCVSASARAAAAGGFTAVYEVLKAMEDAGRIRRGYFAAGVGAAQFALPGAVDRMRAVAAELAGREGEVTTLNVAFPAGPSRQTRTITLSR